MKNRRLTYGSAQFPHDSGCQDLVEPQIVSDLTNNDNCDN